MDEVSPILKEFFSRLPKREDGTIDYHGSREAAVINVFVTYEDDILLLKRSGKVNSYQGKWNCVGGYLDELKPVRQKAFEEINEELGIEESSILSVKIGRIHKFADDNIGKTWIITPILVRLKSKPKIRLDWEHTDCRWIKESEFDDFDIVPRLKESFRSVNE